MSTSIWETLDGSASGKQEFSYADICFLSFMPGPSTLRGGLEVNFFLQYEKIAYDLVVKMLTAPFFYVLLPSEYLHWSYLSHLFWSHFPIPTATSLVQAFVVSGLITQTAP